MHRVIKVVVSGDDNEDERHEILLALGFELECQALELARRVC